MPETVCNTSPIQYLHQAGHLALLRELYGRLLLPEAVAGEIERGRRAGVDLPDPATVDWIEVCRVTPTLFPLPRDIHRGEAEVIALAGSLPHALMILDDTAARRHARLLGLRFTGTLGVILRAKSVGLLPAVEPVVGVFESCGFHMTERIRSEILRLAGES